MGRAAGRPLGRNHRAWTDGSGGGPGHPVDDQVSRHGSRGVGVQGPAQDVHEAGLLADGLELADRAVHHGGGEAAQRAVDPSRVGAGRGGGVEGREAHRVRPLGQGQRPAPPVGGAVPGPWRRDVGPGAVSRQQGRCATVDGQGHPDGGDRVGIEGPAVDRRQAEPGHQRVQVPDGGVRHDHGLAAQRGVDARGAGNVHGTRADAVGAVRHVHDEREAVRSALARVGRGHVGARPVGRDEPGGPAVHGVGHRGWPGRVGVHGPAAERHATGQAADRVDVPEGVDGCREQQRPRGRMEDPIGGELLRGLEAADGGDALVAVVTVGDDAQRRLQHAHGGAGRAPLKGEGAVGPQHRKVGGRARRDDGGGRWNRSGRPGGAVVDRGHCAVPERRHLLGAVPAEGEVDVAGVRVDAAVGPPARGVVHPEDVVVPDHVHDAQPPGHGAGVAPAVGCEQPAEQRVDAGDVRGVVRRDAPVPGPPLLVLALTARSAILHDPEAGRGGVGAKDQVPERRHADLGHRVTDALADVGLWVLDRGGQARRRRGHRDGCGGQGRQHDGAGAQQCARHQDCQPARGQERGADHVELRRSGERPRCGSLLGVRRI